MPAPRRKRSESKADEARTRRLAKAARPAGQPVELYPHEKEALAAFDAGRKMQFLAWHRRGHKDWYSMHVTGREMRANVGSYWHLLPKHVQARRAIWNGIDHQTGKRFVELFFPDAVAVNNTEMYIELDGGSTWQLLGSDNYDRMVGANPRGVVFSEYALCDPRAREYIFPILRANKGWALFPTTFRGRNHAWQLYNAVKALPDWFTSLKTIEDTGIVTPQDVERDRQTGVSERRIREEYYCEPTPPASLGPYARAYESLDTLGNVRELPQSFVASSTHRVGAALVNGYLATVQAAVRGPHVYIYGGTIKSNAGLHETPTHAEATFHVGDDLAADVVRGLRAPLVNTRRASIVETVGFIERAIVSPSSVLAAALSGSLDVMIRDDEEPDIASATTAVFEAAERLAASPVVNHVWGPKIDYSKQDRTVIGYRRDQR